MSKFRLLEFPVAGAIERKPSEIVMTFRLGEVPLDDHGTVLQMSKDLVTMCKQLEKMPKQYRRQHPCLTQSFTLWKITDYLWQCKRIRICLTCTLHVLCIHQDSNNTSDPLSVASVLICLLTFTLCDKQTQPCLLYLNSQV